MHPYLAEVFSRLDESRSLLRAAVNAVPPELHQQRPAPDRWSVAELLEHLALVETRFTGMLAARIEQALNEGLPPESGAAREPLPEPLAQRLVDRSNRRQAPDTAIPSGAVDAATALADAERARAALRECLLRADGLALSTVRERHAFFGELTAYQWIELIAAHERRHVEQLDELRRHLTGAA